MSALLVNCRSKWVGATSSFVESVVSRLVEVAVEAMVMTGAFETVPEASAQQLMTPATSTIHEQNANFMP
jgi:hypothetical protein